MATTLNRPGERDRIKKENKMIKFRVVYFCCKATRDVYNSCLTVRLNEFENDLHF